MCTGMIGAQVHWLCDISPLCWIPAVFPAVYQYPADWLLACSNFSLLKHHLTEIYSYICIHMYIYTHACMYIHIHIRAEKKTLPGDINKHMTQAFCSIVNIMQLHKHLWELKSQWETATFLPFSIKILQVLNNIQYQVSLLYCFKFKFTYLLQKYQNGLL